MKTENEKLKEENKRLLYDNSLLSIEIDKLKGGKAIKIDPYKNSIETMLEEIVVLTERIKIVSRKGQL